MKKIFILAGVVIVMLVGGFFALNSYIYQEKQDANESETNDPADLDDGLWGESEESVFCTMDVMMCPDGSYVSRQGPNCEFATCPGSTPAPAPSEPVACTMEAKICPDGSAVGRQGPNCEFAPCPGEVQ